MDITFDGIVAAGFHGLPYFMHEKSGCFFRDAEPFSHIVCRKAFYKSRHFKTYEEGFTNTKLYFVEQRIGRGRFRMATFVAGT